MTLPPIALPHKYRIKVDKPRLRVFGGALGEDSGVPVQHIDRLGTRFAIDVTIPVMRTEPHGRIWSSRLCQAKLRGAILRYNQDGFAVGSPGDPVVDGAGQSGMSLAMRNFTPHYAVREGQAFNLVHAGRNYLHFAAAPAAADASGKLTLTLYPMLRVIPDDGDALNFRKPVIEGSISGNEASWTRLTAPFCDFGTITISEDE